MLNKKALAATAAAAEPVYIEDTFSTYLYTGNGSTQTITNGIDLSGEGGLVWMKSRSTAGDHHVLTDTVTGATKQLASNLTDQQYTYAGYGLTAFNSNGFSLTDTSGGGYYVNGSSKTYASWTFRKAEKFFDVVTYTGTETTQTISHNLGSVPGCIIVKRTDSTGNWVVYHRSIGNTKYLILNGTNAEDTSPAVWGNTTPTSTVFTIATTNGSVNAIGGTYVAYLFAHDAGGFGDAGDQSVISCGSFTTDSSGNATVTLGWEPQFVLFKASSATGNWFIEDTMRGMTVGTDYDLYPNLSSAEFSTTDRISPTATGFTSGGSNAGSTTFIYIAIRRGPMKTPEVGTDVYTSVAGATGGMTTGFVTDMGFIGQTSGTDKYYWGSRLTGYYVLNSTSTAAQDGGFNGSLTWDRMNGFWNNNLTSYQGWGFRRAPGFFDVVCYTGDGTSNRNVTHNLGVAPELLIVKRRNVADEWNVRAPNTTGELYLSRTNAQDSSFSYLGTSNATTFTLLSSGSQVNGSGSTYVAYLFASVAGVSKVGTYTGNGSSQTINCGFTSGARFVLIKRTDSTGDWVVFDSARGIVSGNDPYLELNTTDAEVTDKDAVDTDSTGFVVNETTGPNINTNSATYIYLAIA